MNTKLAVGAVVLAGALGYLAYLGGAANWQYYLLVDECLAQREDLAGARLRVSGRLAGGSLKIASDRRGATFAIVGTKEPLPVECRGPLPDNLAEGIDVVVEGKLGADGCLHGDRVITRCASKYAAREAEAPSANGAESPTRAADAGKAMVR